MTETNMAGLRILSPAAARAGTHSALAVARERVARHGAEVWFAGTERGLEHGWFRRPGSRCGCDPRGTPEPGFAHHAIADDFGLPASFFESRRLIREFRPAAVLGVGGYASGPVSLPRSA